MTVKSIALSLIIIITVLPILTNLEVMAQSEQSILTAKSSKEQYVLGDRITITGKVWPIKEGSTVKVSWIKPDKETFTNYISPEGDGKYKDTYKLVLNDEEKTDIGGRWNVEISYEGELVDVTFIVIDPFFTISTDRISYEPGDKVRLSGSVKSIIDNENSVSINIMNPSGSVFQTTHPNLVSRSFDHSFILQGPKVLSGEWTINVTYKDGHKTALAFDVIQPLITFSTDRQGYFPGNMVVINGSIGTLAAEQSGDATVEILVKDPLNSTFASTFLAPNNNSSFTYNLELSGPSSAIYGRWQIIATYADHKGIRSFTVNEYSPPVYLKTEKKSYFVEESVKLLGRVSELEGSEKVSIHLFAANGSFLEYAETRVYANYSYAYEFHPSIVNLVPGSYSILVTYNEKDSSIASFIVKNSTIGPIVTVSTNKPEYDTSNDIVVSGKILKGFIDLNEPLIMAVHDNGSGKLVFSSNSTTLNSTSGIFRQQIKTTVDPWKPSNYTVTVTYRDEFATSSFKIMPSVSGGSNYSAWSSINITWEGREYSVAHKLSNATITNMIIDNDAIIITTEAEGDASLEITFPKELMMQLFKPDEYSPYYDITIFIDEKQALADITADCEAATFHIPVHEGTKKVELVDAYGADAALLTPSSGGYFFYHDGLASSGEKYTVGIGTNANSCNISFVQSEKRLHIDVEGPIDNQGYLRVLLDHGFLSGNYTLLLDGQVVTDYNATFISYESAERYGNQMKGDATIISIEYDASPTARSIEIIGASVIPEFDLFLSTILTMTMAIPVISIKSGHVNIRRLRQHFSKT